MQANCHRAGHGQTLAALLLAVVALLGQTSALAGAVSERVKSSASVRVCIWPDYYGISLRDPRTQQLSGIDIELSAQLARDLGVRLAYVDSSFATLIEDLASDRCDVAMFAVGITAQRQRALRFT